MRADGRRLADILEAIERIRTRVGEGREAFDRDELIQVWVVHHLQLIGEAARGVSEELRRSHPEVPWSKMVGMRHVLVHDYFAVDLDVVWSAVERDLPELEGPVRNVLAELDAT